MYTQRVGRARLARTARVRGARAMSGAGLMAGARPCAVTRAGQPGGMAKKKTTTPDERAGRVAQQHHGLITAAQALRCGISSTEVSRRVAREIGRAHV